MMWPEYVLGCCTLLEPGQRIPGYKTVGATHNQRVNGRPRTRFEWDQYWTWWPRHYQGIKALCGGYKWKQRHAFTHMGLEEA